MNRKERVVWEKLNNPFGAAQTRTMEEVVSILQKYVATYDQQYGYENYHDETYIDDILYGLGSSLDENYKNADGFERFKDFLRDYLGPKKDD